MSDEYRVKGTSRATAAVNNVVLTNPDEYERALTRRIFRPMLVENANNREASVKGWLMHQRRGNNKADWQDADSFNAATLKAGQQLKLELTAGQVWRLYQALRELYELPIGNWDRGVVQQYKVVEVGVMVLDEQKKQLIEKLVQEEGEPFWDHIASLSPGLLQVVALKQQNQTRQLALEEFERHIASNDWRETEWQPFFEQNRWIFGHNLAYQFLNPVAGQPNYGVTSFDGTGGQRGDFLMATDAQAASFTVLVDIKRPNSSTFR